MPNNLLGELRRSAAIGFGPGSVVDFRADNAPVSAVVAGLEEWDKSFPPKGLMNPQVIHEPRLQKKLSVSGFRLPPVVDESWKNERGEPDGRSLVAARFPQWLLCPSCNRTAPANRWSRDPGKAYRFCADCTNRLPGRKKTFAVPVRFVMACPNGHLDDFPWHFWVNHKEGCAHNYSSDLYLNTKNPGLSGLELSCRNCGASTTMDGIFNISHWKNFKCSGKRPWLDGTSSETCDMQPRVLQRGASNLYFPIIESALSIPPWSDSLQESLSIYWNALTQVDETQLDGFVEMLSMGDLKHVLIEYSLTAKELAGQIRSRVKNYNSDEITHIRQEEYQQFVQANVSAKGNADEFEIRGEQIPDSLLRYFSRIARIVRLREVRAIAGFTRINPSDHSESKNYSKLSESNLDWLPAIEVRGEGIFLELNSELLSEWESNSELKTRARKVHDNWIAHWQKNNGDMECPLVISPRYLLIHTLSHALMRQLTLECGYSSASLRERLYVDEGEREMAGLLIYTATSDSDGTLGGLQRNGKGHRLEKTLSKAIDAMRWCSSDPLCIHGLIADDFSLSTCHACTLAPETSCEEFNRFLDRALLVGYPEKPEFGFFSQLQ